MHILTLMKFEKFKFALTRNRTWDLTVLLGKCSENIRITKQPCALNQLSYQSSKLIQMSIFFDCINFQIKNLRSQLFLYLLPYYVSSAQARD